MSKFVSFELHTSLQVHRPKYTFSAYQVWKNLTLFGKNLCKFEDKTSFTQELSYKMWSNIDLYLYQIVFPLPIRTEISISKSFITGE